MIYYITKQQNFTKGQGYELCPFSTLEEWFNSKDIIELDTETKGLDHTKEVILIQFGSFEDQFVVNYQEYKVEVLELLKKHKKKIYIIHHAQFDLRFLIYEGIHLTNIWDTCVTEKVLMNGIKFIDGVKQSASLQFIANKYLGIYLSKEERGHIHKGISDSVIIYAANDVKYLGKIRGFQIKDILSKGLDSSVRLQNRFVSVLAKMVVNGIYLNYPKWMEKVNIYKAKLGRIRELLNEEVIADPNLSKFVSRQLDLFNPPKCNINWASSKQVIPFMQALGIPTKVPDKEKGGFKDSVDSKHISKFRNKHAVIPVYLEYKEIEKELSTYGEGWSKFIDKATGRIHSTFNQYLDTGRLSSGDKKANKPNLQNIPADKLTRGCFTNQHEGWSIVSIDYASQESVVCAEFSQDPTMLDIVNNGKDMHCITATAISHVFLGETVEVTKDNGIKTPKGTKLRDEAKAVNFAIQYGCQKYTLSNNLQCDVDTADEILKATVKQFHKRHEYFETKFREAMQTGYIEFNHVIKAKYFIERYSWIKEIVDVYGGFYNGESFKFRNYMDKDTHREFNKLISEIKRLCMNYPIQATSGEITKLAMIYIDDALINNNLDEHIKVVNCIHDEILFEIKDEYLMYVPALVKLMEKAGAVFCKTVVLKAEPAIGKEWIK